MTDQPRTARRVIPTVIAILFVVATLIGLLAMRVNALLFRRNLVSLDSLKFPVLVLQPGGAAPFAEWDSVALEKFPEKSPRTPQDGTILIDSEFNLFAQGNVHRKQEGELKFFVRYLLPDLRVKYTFDLRRMKDAGRDAAIKRLLECPDLSGDPAAGDAAVRKLLSSQTTLAGILDALKLYKPVEPLPATQPASDSHEAQPTTQETESGEPLPNG